MLTNSRRYTSRPARELVCPECSGAVQLAGGALHCVNLGEDGIWFSCGEWPELADLATGDRLLPDCHLTALPCWFRRSARECREWFARGRLN